MNIISDVGFRVVNHIVNIPIIKLDIRTKCIAVNSRAFLDMLANFSMKRLAAHIWKDRCSDFAVALKQSHNSDLSNSTGSANSTTANALVHVTSLATNECFINL